MAKRVKVRTVRSKEDRKRPSIYMRLKTDEYFKAYALFEPDMELEDNPGFYEYFDHWDEQARQYVPCIGDKCTFCRANDNPSTRALSLWYFPDNEKKDQLKVFTMNYSTTQDASDISEEEEGILGKVFRVKRLSDKGEYRLRPGTDKKLTKKQIADLLKEAPDLEELVQKQAKIQMERLSALDALEDDDDDDDDVIEDDDDEEETPKSKTRGGKKKADEDEDDDDDDDEEDEDDEDDSDDDDEDESDDDDDDDEDENDDDDEDEDDEDSEDDEDDDDDEAAEEITDGKYEVVKFNESEETLDLKGDEGKVKMWLGQGVDAPDDCKKGMKVKLSAAKDDEGDWIITAISKGGRGRPKGSKNKK